MDPEDGPVLLVPDDMRRTLPTTNAQLTGFPARRLKEEKVDLCAGALQLLLHCADRNGSWAFCQEEAGAFIDCKVARNSRIEEISRSWVLGRVEREGEAACLYRICIWWALSFER